MRKLLLVIDMQYDFIRGTLGTPEAREVVESVVEEIRHYDPKDIIATRDTHGDNYLSTQEGRNLPIPHCIQGTPGWELDSSVAEALGDALIINKPTFGSLELIHLLREMAQKEELEITLVGLCTDICVVSNALAIKMALPETPVQVIAGCCAGVTPESHQAALTTMRMCQVQIR